MVLAGLDRLEEADQQAPRAEPVEATGPVGTGKGPAEHAKRTEHPARFAPDGPPVDVVGETLAAEAAAERGDVPSGDGVAHEPRGASRDEEHGESALQRVEADEIAEEAAGALEGDIEPEEHLAQPLLDPADTKAVASDLRMMSRAAEPDPE
jgi:hypothetical protein